MTDSKRDTNYDIIVAGGGFAGCAAAVAAARTGTGKKVLLIEKSGALGGAANVNLVNPFMRYYTKDPEGKPLTVLSRGIFGEIVGRLAEKGGIRGNLFSEETLKTVLDEMCAEAGVKVLFHALVCGADASDGFVKSVSAAGKSGIMTLSASYFVDATADADLSFLAGFPCRLGREKDGLCQPMTLCFRVGNIDTVLFRKSLDIMQRAYLEAKESGATDNPRENILCFDTLSPGVVHFNTTRIVKLDPVDPFDLSEAEIAARRQVADIVKLLREKVPGCEECVLLSTASEIGVRESRMIDGLYTLTADEIKACCRFDDGIAACNYDIDIHNPEGSGTSHYYFKGNDYYTIPYRCLVPSGSKNLLAAGRCISVTHEVQASVRIMPVCCCLGEAAGTGAALAAGSGCGVAEVAPSAVRAAITGAGGFVG
ncbi:MAG: FAD-dependent oxidoreductase [Clostridia bacterium]|nr:FAD-dependent oxidoreductase [Clostridia bacterium]